MIEKFLEKFLPQITERVNENAELGQALIETLAVLDNYATLNNVQFTDEQINAMLGVVPEPEPEPVIDIPAQIVELVEKKKGGSKPKKWDWRFKTTQELRTDFPKLEYEGWWVKAKEYLLGQKIKFSAVGKKYFEDYVFTKKPASEVPVVDTKEYFGITSDDDDVWTVVYQMVTQDPLPTESETTSPAAPDVFWGYEIDFNNRYLNKIRSIEFRYSYITWEEVVELYSKTDIQFKLNFVQSVLIVLNNARFLNEFKEITVKRALEQNAPTPEMLELFSQNYYFSPPLVDFYISNDYQIGLDPTIIANRVRNGVPNNKTFSDIISIGIDSELLNGSSYPLRGYSGLGCYLPMGAYFCPDIITINYTGKIWEAYNTRKADNVASVKISEIGQNAYYDKNIGLSSTYNGNDIMGRFVPLAIAYGLSISEYSDLFQVKSDWVYIQNSKSDLSSYIAAQRPVNQNEYIYPAFLKMVIEPIFVLTDYDELVYQFEKNGFIDSQQASELLVLGNVMQFRGSGGENLLFFQSIATNSLSKTTAATLLTKLKQFRQLSGTQSKLSGMFIDLFYDKVIAPSSQFVLSEYKKKTEGATAQITPVTQPTPTTWNWRFKTEEEFVKDYGKNWRGTFWTSDNTKDYLFGQPIVETDESRKVIEKNYGGNYFIEQLLGIKAPIGQSDYFGFTPQMEITQDPLPTTAAPVTQTGWSWRFKTLDEFVEEYGDDWVDKVDWLGDGEMDYLLGQEIAETTESKEAIKELTARTSSKALNTFDVLGITSGGRDLFRINTDMLINKPLPTATAPKKRGRKPKTAWNWRFKTEEELYNEYGANYGSYWGASGRNYLFGKAIPKTAETEEFIKQILNATSPSNGVDADTKKLFGIDSGNGQFANNWVFTKVMVTQDPFPTTAAPAKSEPKKRGRKPKSELPEIDLGGLEDIGDIDIDDIDFDNLVI